MWECSIAAVSACQHQPPPELTKSKQKNKSKKHNNIAKEVY